MADNNNDNKFCLPDVSASIIQQLYKLITEEGEVKDKNVFPISILQAIYDGTTGTRLDQILSLNNYWYVPYEHDNASTRVKIQQGLRRRGLLLSFRDVKNVPYIQKYIGDKYDDDSWGNDANWLDVFDSLHDNEVADRLKDYLVDYIDKHYQDKLDQAVDDAKAYTDIVKKVVWNNHASCFIKASPNPIEKGVGVTVTISWGGSLAGFDNPNITYTVKKNGSNWINEGTSKNDNLTDSTLYHVDATIEGTDKSADVTVNAYYPIYVFGSNNANITALPGNAVKQPIAGSPAGTKSIIVGNAEYFYIIYPATMNDIKSASMGGFDAPITKLNNITIEGKGDYKVYRSAKTQNAGTLNITFNV